MNYCIRCGHWRGLDLHSWWCRECMAKGGYDFTPRPPETPERDP